LGGDRGRIAGYYFPVIAPLDLALGLLALLVAAAVIARRASFPEPLVFVPVGIAASYAPHVPEVTLDPALVLELFLPLLVYATAIRIPWRGFRHNLRPIAFLAVGLVAFTTLGVAVVAHSIVPALTWAAAFALGAIVSPPDVVAAASVITRLRVPRRIAVILQGEGLVNDVSALTIFRFAVIAAVSGSFSVSHASLFFLATLVGGAAYGFAVGWAALKLRDYLGDARLETTVSLITPFVAYLGPEYFDSTGVLATAVAGLVVSAQAPHRISAQTRLRSLPVWEMIDFWLNGVLFLMLGLQLKGLLSLVPPGDLGSWAGVSIAIGLAAIVLRFVWVYLIVYAPRLWATGGESVPRRNAVFMISWTGMRGAISLAAALSLPLTLADGSPFPARDLIIFATFAVILLTLVVQGSTLPFLIRRLGLESEGRAEEHRDTEREYEARKKVLDAGIERVEALVGEGKVSREWGERHRRELAERRETYGRHGAARTDDAARASAQAELEAHISAGAAQREALLALREAEAIDDEVLHRIEIDLDQQEMRLRARIAALPGPQR
jgi:Na+/H+ antiporter